MVWKVDPHISSANRSTHVSESAQNFLDAINDDPVVAKEIFDSAQKHRDIITEANTLRGNDNSRQAVILRHAARVLLRGQDLHISFTRSIEIEIAKELVDHPAESIDHERVTRLRVYVGYLIAEREVQPDYPKTEN